MFTWLNQFYMSGEQLTTKDQDKILKAYSSKRVDINNLLSKVRQEKNKERKENLIFVGLICSVIAVTGIIASF